MQKTYQPPGTGKYVKGLVFQGDRFLRKAFRLGSPDGKGLNFDIIIANRKQFTVNECLSERRKYLGNVSNAFWLF
jgi:hypothetical protein